MVGVIYLVTHLFRSLMSNLAGWLTLALRNSRAADIPDVLVPPSSLSDSEEDDASGLTAGLSIFRLGSPIHLEERRSPSPVSPTSSINAELPSLCESLRVCNPSLVAQFTVKNLLPYSPGQLEDGSVAHAVTPIRRNRRGMGSPAPSSPVVRSHVYLVSSPSPQQGVVEANPTIVPAMRGRRIKWPSVSVSSQAE
jgi:hypothetical protein